MKRELFRPKYRLTYWVLGLSVLLATAVFVLAVRSLSVLSSDTTFSRTS